MKIKEIKEKESDALKQELAEKHKHLFDLRTQAVTEKLEDPTQLGKTKKDIARYKTILRQRELQTVALAASEKTTGEKTTGEKTTGEK
jgi:large subunit ribosomal protein L29